MAHFLFSLFAFRTPPVPVLRRLALSDYYEMNITARFDDPNMVTLSEMEDPYFYADRLTMPKLVFFFIVFFKYNS